MITSENCIRLCASCPNRQAEGGAINEPQPGDLIARQPRYVNARFEFVGGAEEVANTHEPVREFATVFVDSEGNKTQAFLPGVQLGDIAACSEPVPSGRKRFLRKNKQYDCGAEAQKLRMIRERLNTKEA